MYLDFRGNDGRSGIDGRDGRAGAAGRKVLNPHTGREEQKQGEDGGAGTDAGDGTHATDGEDVGFDVVVESDRVFLVSGEHRYEVAGPVNIDVSGGNGGNGGDGGSGGAGGSGNPPGRKGKDGGGGDGGRGGNGGEVLVRAEDPHLLPMIRVTARAGRGGLGGRGDPWGANGSIGQPGSSTYVAQIEGRPYQSSSCGLHPHTINVVGDGSRRNGIFTAGSRFTIDSVIVANEHGIPMPAPFRMGLVIEPDTVVFEGDILENEDRDIPEEAEVALDTDFRVHIPEDFGVGYFALAPVPFVRVGDRTMVLTDPERVEGRFELAVNHRYSIERENFPEVRDEDWEAIINRLEGYTPHEQYTASVILLLHPILAQKREYDDQARAQEHYGHLLEELEGELFSFEIHEQLLDDEAFQDIPSRYPELGKTLAIQFLGRFNESVRRKLVDCMYFAATMGDRIEADHKQHIRRCGEALLDEADWLRANYPAVYESRSTKVGASSSNRTPTLLFPVIPLAVLLALNVGDTDLLMALGVWRPTGFFTLPAGDQRILLIVLIPLFLTAAWLVRKAFFRKACPRCGSVRLEPLSDSDDGGSDASRATHRCPDCGARSSEEMGTNISQLQLDCFSTNGKAGILDSVPGLRWILWILNVAAFVLFPVPWLVLALMTFVGGFTGERSFGDAAKRSALAGAGVLVLLEVGRSLLSQ